MLFRSKDLLDFAGIKNVLSLAGIKDLLSFVGTKDILGFAGIKDLQGFAGIMELLYFAKPVGGAKELVHFVNLVLGNSPKFHIESLGRTFIGGTHTFGILMLNAPRGTFLPLSVS